MLDKFLDELGMGDYFLEKGTPEEQKNKKRRFLELKDDVYKAFCKDMAEKAENNQSVLTSSSSSPKERVNQNKVRKS